MKQILLFIFVIVASTVISHTTISSTLSQTAPNVPDSFSYPVSSRTVEQTGVISAKALEGTVMDGSGFAIPQVLVELLSKDGKRVEAVLTDSQGKFAMKARAPALYALKASLSGFDSLLLTARVTKDEKRGLTLKLTASH